MGLLSSLAGLRVGSSPNSSKLGRDPGGAGGLGLSFLKSYFPLGLDWREGSELADRRVLGQAVYSSNEAHLLL